MNECYQSFLIIPFPTNQRKRNIHRVIYKDDKNNDNNNYNNDNDDNDDDDDNNNNNNNNAVAAGLALWQLSAFSVPVPVSSA